MTGSRVRRRGRWVWRVSAAVVAAALVGVPAAGASADQPSNWWYDAYHVAQAHQAGFTGKGVKVAVIDQQINSGLPTFDGANLTVSPTPLCSNAGATVATTQVSTASVHGTTVTALLVGNGTGPDQVQGIAPGADVTFYGQGLGDNMSCSRPSASTSAQGAGGLSVFGRGIEAAIAGGAKVVSISMGSTASIADAQVIARALADGVIIVGAQPDSGGQGLEADAFPSTYNGVVAVNAIDSSSALQTSADGSTDIQPGTTVVAAGVDMPWLDWSAGTSTAWGSSFATPLVAGMLAAAWQAHPRASADQMIQSLIHTTGGTPSSRLQYDQSGGTGYGAASLTGMLKDDPLKYPDVNPLMDKPGNAYGPSQAQVAAARAQASPRAKASASPPAAAAASRGGSGLLSGLLVAAIVVGLLVVAGAVVLTVVLVRRSRRPAWTPDGPHP